MTVRSGAKLIAHRKVAKLLGVDTETLRNWVARGEFPEPLAVVTTHTWLYRAEWIDHFVEHGVWPEGVRFRRA